MTATDGVEASLVDDVFDGVESYEIAPAPVRGFLAWHRPRKHFVRTRQWVSAIKRLIDDHPLQDGPLRYLGLPGEDLIDLRHIQRTICESEGISLRFLGFNSGAAENSPQYASMNLSLDEVRRLPDVDESSEILPDDFALLARSESVAFARAKMHGPFDIVNLDLCDGFAKGLPSSESNTLYNAIQSLLVLQSRRPRPWLLFLTTRVDRPNVKTQVLNILRGIYQGNLDMGGEFLDDSVSSFSIGCAADLEREIETELGHQRVFLTGLSKWFIGKGLGEKPPSRVDLLSVMGYQVDAKSSVEDLASLAFRVTPLDSPSPDPTGLALLATTMPDEVSLAAKALRKVSKITDVDGKLRDNAQLSAELVDGMAELVELARYDPELYREWAMSDI